MQAPDGSNKYEPYDADEYHRGSKLHHKNGLPNSICAGQSRIGLPISILEIKRDKIMKSINPARVIRSNIQGMSTFYYNEERNKIYEVALDFYWNNITLKDPTDETDAQLRELNHLPAKQQ